MEMGDDLSHVYLSDDPSYNDRDVKVDLTFARGRLFLRPAGTSDKLSCDGTGWPIMLEYYDGKVQLVVWADINQEDPTHNIDLTGALESHRKINP